MKPLKPVMAAILAASPATSFAIMPSNTPSSGGTAITNTAPASPELSDAVAAEKIKEVRFMLQFVTLLRTKPEVRKDVGERMAQFVLSRESGKQYLTDGLLNDKALIKNVSEQAKNWPEANKDHSDKVAALYYVLGVDKVPAWAPADLSDQFKANPVWSNRLTAALAGLGWASTKRVDQSGAVNGTTALLDSAAAWAQKILDDARTKGEIHSSIETNATTAVRPPTTDSPPSPLDSSGSGYGFDDLYVKGAAHANVYSPDDDGYRTLSMKVYTTKDANNNLINRIGLVDITKPDPGSPSPVQWIDITKVGDTDVAFHDGGRPYTVTIGQDGSITVKRKGAGDGGGQLTTNKVDLLTRRNNQIASGGVVSIGQPPQPYYVLPQGGAKGSWLFFPQSQIDQLRADQAAGRDPNLNAYPDLMGDVVTGAAGGAIPIKGRPDLGTLPNGDPYHLEFDMATRTWKVVAGKGDTDTPPKAATTSTTTTTSPPDPANPTQPAPPAPATAPKTLAEAIEQAKADKSDKTQVWAEDDGNSGFDDATLARIRIMSNQRDTDGMTHFKVLFDPSLGVSNNSFEFQAINNGIRLLHIRGVKNYVALEYGVGTQYYDLQNFANYVQHTNDSSLSYAQAGSYDVSKGQMSDVTSADIVEDVLTHYLKVKSDDAMLATVRSRITDHAKGRGYVISGNTTTLYMGVGEEGRTIWPKDIASGDTGNNDKMTGLRGPGTAVEVTGGATGDFKKEMDIGSGRTATLVKTENHAAVYASEEDENVGGKTSTVKVWSVMLEYKNDNGLASRSKALPVFGTGKNRYQLPANLHMQGLPDVKLPSSTQLGMLYGSNQENGAIVAYRFTPPDAQGGSNVRDKKGNCGGPVLWWGNVTKEKAQAACESDGKL